MKSAEEWQHEIWRRPDELTVADIRAIQADALRHAVWLCSQFCETGFYDEQDPKVMQCVKAIKEAATKLEEQK